MSHPVHVHVQYSVLCMYTVLYMYRQYMYMYMYSCTMYSTVHVISRRSEAAARGKVIVSHWCVQTSVSTEKCVVVQITLLS